VAKDFVAAFAQFEAAQALCEASDAKATKAGPAAAAAPHCLLIVHLPTTAVGLPRRPMTVSSEMLKLSYHGNEWPGQG